MFEGFEWSLEIILLIVAASVSLIALVAMILNMHRLDILSQHVQADSLSEYDQSVATMTKQVKTFLSNHDSLINSQIAIRDSTTTDEHIALASERATQLAQWRETKIDQDVSSGASPTFAGITSKLSSSTISYGQFVNVGTVGTGVTGMGALVRSMYCRVGDVVYVTWAVTDMTVTSSLDYRSFYLNLPVATTFTDKSQAIATGNFVGYGTNFTEKIYGGAVHGHADVGTSRVIVHVTTPLDAVSKFMVNISYMYTII